MTGSTSVWSLTAPNGIGVYVEATRLDTSVATAVKFDLLAGASGFVRHARAGRRLSLPLDGEAARVPAVMFLVFETGGHAYAFETLEEAGDDLEALDLNDGHYIGAFSDRGEIINMSQEVGGFTSAPPAHSTGPPYNR